MPGQATSLPAVPALLEPAPCDACRFVARCKAEQLACEAFSMFAADESEARWRAAPRTPTRARYAVLFR